MFNDPLDKGGDYYQDPTGSASGGAQAVYFHGGYQRISHASGNHWSNALDESRVGDGPYAAFWESVLGFIDDGGSGDLNVAQRHGGWGFWGQTTWRDYASGNEKDLHTVQLTSKWYEGTNASQGAGKSNPASWVFTTSKSNGNVQTAGVSGIDKWFFEARFINWNDIKLQYGHVTLPTLYFEYPKVTNMFYKKNEVLPESFAALIMAKATDRAIKQTSDWFYKQENPSVWDTKIQLMKNLTQQVLRDGGRVTTAPNYAPVIVTPYRRL